MLKASAFLVQPAALLIKQRVPVGVPLRVHLEVLRNKLESRK